MSHFLVSRIFSHPVSTLLFYLIKREALRNIKPFTRNLYHWWCDVIPAKEINIRAANHENLKKTESNENSRSYSTQQSAYSSHGRAPPASPCRRPTVTVLGSVEARSPADFVDVAARDLFWMKRTWRCRWAQANVVFLTYCWETNSSLLAAVSTALTAALPRPTRRMARISSSISTTLSTLNGGRVAHVWQSPNQLRGGLDQHESSQDFVMWPFRASDVL